MSGHQAVARFVAVPAIVLGIATGCSSSSSSTTTPPATTDGGTTTSGHPANVVNMAANDWLSAELNDQVAGILLQEQLQITVNHIPATTAGQWDQVRQGALDVSLEVWPSGHPDEMAKLNGGDPTVENGGLLGPTAKVGWIIPTYLLTEHPELATWEGYKDPKNVALFQSASSGTKGRFVGGDPSWVQYDQKIINNLGLNFEVEMAGSEAAELAQLDAAYTKRQAILFYLWIPHWAWAKYDLTMVTLPANTDACWAQAASATGPNCDYPTDHLFKLVRPGLKTDAPVAYQFLKNMSYTTKDQITMMADVTENGMTVEAAARKWLAANTTTWKSWLPASQ
jgi:glycine betaine/proline transport system substrate-binding protein